MGFQPFELERLQSHWEHEVEINLTESGVSPLTLGELLDDPRSRPFLFDYELGYTQTNGTKALRECIAALYPKVDASNVIVTNGGAEANLIVAWNLFLESGRKGELVLLVPNYMQLYGIWKNLGGRVRLFHLEMKDDRWVPNIEELKSVITQNAAAIAICTPNNPTGSILSEPDMHAIADISNDHGLWLISDEIYRGAEFSGSKSPSAYGLTEKALITSGLSKVYGLPGLRIGWVISTDSQKAEELWSYSDYTTICPSALSDYLATIALQPENRVRLEERAREKVVANWDVMKAWLDTNSDVFTYAPPEAASMCFPHYNLDITSIDLVEKLRREKDVLIAPGSHFGTEHHLRIGFGYSVDKLREGLRRFGELLLSLSS